MALPPGLNSGIFGGQLVNTKPDPNFIPTYTGDSEYGSIMNDYYQSEMFDRDAYTNVSAIQPTISLMNPLFGSMGSGQMGQMGNFNDFLKSIGSDLDTLNDPDKYDLALEIISDPFY